MEIDKKRIAELVIKLQGGDKSAFSELYNLTNKRAYFVALEFLKNDHDAEDILQESYVKALSKINELDKPESFSSWLNQIVANKSKDFLKKKKPTVFEADENEAFEVIPDEDTEFSPESNLDQSELQKTVMEVLDELSEEKRACVLMMYFEELSVGEIAETLEIPEGTVKTRLFSARKDLKEKFAKRGITSAFSVAPIGVVIWALRNASGAVGSVFAASGASAKVFAGVSAVSATTAAATTATSAATATGGIGAKVAAMTTAQKVVAGVSAVAVATGAGIGTVAVVSSLNVPFYEEIEWAAATADTIVLQNGVIVDFSPDLSGNVEIPEEIDGEEIVEIGDGAFEGCSSLTAVKIPSTVSEIGDQAFNNCDNLETVWLNSNDCVMTRGVFTGNYAFADNEKLVNFIFGEGVTKIPNYICGDLPNLKTVVFLDDVTVIGAGAFRNCISLEETDFSAVKDIGSEAFLGCASLKEAEFSDSLEKIDFDAFNGCSSLEKIEIPQSVREINSGAFNNCENLETVYFNSNDCTVWPMLLGNDYPFEHNEKLTQFVFGKGVTTVLANVCTRVTNLEKVVFLDEVTVIESGAFSGCAKLEEIDFSEVAYIGSEAFLGCASLKEPEFSDSLEKIDFDAFNGCSSFRSITVPQSVREINSGAFNNCENLETVYFNSNDCTVWPTLLGNDYPFEHNEKLTKFVFGKGVTVVSADVCNRVTNLKTVVFEGEISEIENGAFAECNGIAEVQLDKVTEAEWDAVEIGGENEAILSRNVKYNFKR